MASTCVVENCQPELPFYLSSLAVLRLVANWHSVSEIAAMAEEQMAPGKRPKVSSPPKRGEGSACFSLQMNFWCFVFVCVFASQSCTPPRPGYEHHFHASVSLSPLFFFFNGPPGRAAIETVIGTCLPPEAGIYHPPLSDLINV